MKVLTQSKFISKTVGRTASVLGVMGLSAIAIMGVTKPASAANILLGSDYFISPSGQSTFIFDPASVGLPGNPFPVALEGDPIPGLPGQTDTVVQRQRDAIFDDNGDGFLERTSVTIPIEMTQLSLKSVNPLNGFNVFVTLDPNKRTTGEMTIRHNYLNQGGGLVFDDSGIAQGTFDSFLDVFYQAELVPVNGGPAAFTIFDNFRLTQNGAQWTHKPNGVLVRGEVGNQDANCHKLVGPGCFDGKVGSLDFSDFFPIGLVKHEKGSPNFPNGHTTTLETIPEPTTILGAGLAFGFGTLCLKKSARKSKKQALS
jgi:hypothetical protein